MMKKFFILIFFYFTFFLSNSLAQNNELTYLGALKNGSSDGLVPKWEGGLKSSPKNWSSEMGLVDPFNDDKVIDIINHEKISKYEEFLTLGLKKLLKQNSNFKIYLYPSRRSINYPEKIRKKILKNSSLKDIQSNNAGNIYYSPFIKPKSGLEVIKNHLFRFQGGSIERTSHVFPVRSDGTYSRIGVWSKKVYQGNINSKDSNMLFFALARFTEPRSLKGDILLVHEPIDFLLEKRSTWIYSAAQRRVRRAPDVAYDGVGNGSEGMITADQVDGFNGATDRYNWKLIGKKTLIIPYNTYKVGDKKVSYDEIVKIGSVNSSLMRFEHHRVWIVKATLKKGMRHIYNERIFYIDEDSWAVVMEEVFTKEGEIWRFAIHGLVQSYDFNIPFYRLSIYHDLYKKSYLLTGLDNKIKTPIKFGFEAKISDFRPNALRRMGGKP